MGNAAARVEGLGLMTDHYPTTTPPLPDRLTASQPLGGNERRVRVKISLSQQLACDQGRFLSVPVATYLSRDLPCCRSIWMVAAGRLDFG